MPFFYFGYGSDWTLFYILFFAVAIFSVWAQYKVNATFKKYSNVPVRNGKTGRQAAEMVLTSNDVRGVDLSKVAGSLTDHYDPKTKTINLSEPVYDKSSVAALGVAAHEAGHAVQDAKSYAPLKLRHAIVKTTNIASNISVPLIMIGILLMAFSDGTLGLTVANIGIVAFSAIAFFQLVTLPVEFNASRRAVIALSQSGTMDDDEIKGVKKVLTAAALTYVAALAAALVNLLRMILLVNGNRRRD